MCRRYAWASIVTGMRDVLAMANKEQLSYHEELTLPRQGQRVRMVINTAKVLQKGVCGSRQSGRPVSYSSIPSIKEVWGEDKDAADVCCLLARVERRGV